VALYATKQEHCTYQSVFRRPSGAQALSLGSLKRILAGAIELDRPYINLMEVGTKQPSLSVLWKIAGGLRMTAGEFAVRVEAQVTLLREKASASVAK